MLMPNCRKLRNSSHSTVGGSGRYATGKVGDKRDGGGATYLSGWRCELAISSGAHRNENTQKMSPRRNDETFSRSSGLDSSHKQAAFFYDEWLLAIALQSGLLMYRKKKSPINKWDFSFWDSVPHRPTSTETNDRTT